MSVTLFVYNATAQVFEAASSFDDITFRTTKRIPPGSQGAIALADQNAVSTVSAQNAKYGAVDHSTVSQPATFTGKSYSTTQIAIAGKKIPVV